MGSPQHIMSSSSRRLVSPQQPDEEQAGRAARRTDRIVVASDAVHDEASTLTRRVLRALWRWCRAAGRVFSTGIKNRSMR